MTKMVAMPIYGIKSLKRFSKTSRPMACSNDDPGLTVTYFTAMSTFLPNAFVWENDFIETIEVYELKTGTKEAKVIV